MRKHWFTLSRHDDPPSPEPTPKPDPAKPDPEPKTFTQAELDAIVGDRLKRQKAQFADYDDVKAKASKYDEIEQQSKTELEKVQAERDAAVKVAADAADRARREALRSAIVAEAAKAGAVAPEQVVALLPAGAVTVNDDGTVEGAADAVKTFLEENKHFKADGRPAGTIDQGPRNDDPIDFRKADKAAVAAELNKLGVSRW